MGRKEYLEGTEDDVKITVQRRKSFLKKMDDKAKDDKKLKDYKEWRK